MTTTTEMHEMITSALTKDAPESARVNELLVVYARAKAAVDAYGDVQDQVKAKLTEIIARTDQPTWDVPEGKIIVTAPSVSASYDTKALDALCASNDALSRVLQPHRKVSERAGSLRITLKK